MSCSRQWRSSAWRSARRTSRQCLLKPAAATSAASHTKVDFPVWLNLWTLYPPGKERAHLVDVRLTCLINITYLLTYLLISLKSHQSFITLCITSSLEATFRQPCVSHFPDDVTLFEFVFHLLTAFTIHHVCTISFQAQNSPAPQILSFHHGLVAASGLYLLNRIYPAKRLSCFSFSYFFLPYFCF